MEDSNLNGQVVEIEGAKVGVWKVRIPQGNSLNVGSDRLRFVFPDRPQQKALIKSVQTRPELNGKTVTLSAYHVDQRRYECSLIGSGGQKPLSLLPEKLSTLDNQPVEPPVFYRNSSLGRTTVASRCFDPGEVIFVERPAWQLQKKSKAFISSSEGSSLFAYDEAAVARTFLDLPEEKRRDLLSLAPVDVLKDAVRNKHGRIDLNAQYSALPAKDEQDILAGFEAKGLSLTAEEKADVLLFMKVLKNNAFEFEDKAALLFHHSRINHSCKPNAHRGTERADGRTPLVATRRIEAGSEITLSYKEVFMLPREKRLERLRGWFEECLCARCQQETDDMRSFKCPRKCGGHGFLAWRNNTISPCDKCGATRSDEATVALLEAEASLVRLHHDVSSRIAGASAEDIIRAASHFFAEANRSGMGLAHWAVAGMHKEAGETLAKQMLGRAAPGSGGFVYLVSQLEAWLRCRAKVDASPCEGGYACLEALASAKVHVGGIRLVGEAIKAQSAAMDMRRLMGGQPDEMQRKMMGTLLPGVAIDPPSQCCP